MHIPRWLIWLLLYALATFAWIVLFEHGVGEQRFKAGAAHEFDRLVTAVGHLMDRLRQGR